MGKDKHLVSAKLRIVVEISKPKKLPVRESKIFYPILPNEKACTQVLGIKFIDMEIDPPTRTRESSGSW